MSSVERELWDVFTSYTLFANPLDPFHMTFNTLNKLCRDCGLFELDAFPGYLSEADLYVLFTLESRVLSSHRRNQNSAGSGQPTPVPYGVFLNLLLRIAEQLFTPQPSPATSTIMSTAMTANSDTTSAALPFTPQQSLQKLLMEHIFVETQRDVHRKIRKAEHVNDLMQDSTVKGLYRFYKDALKQLFDFYGQVSTDVVNKQVNVKRRATTPRSYEAGAKRVGMMKQGNPTTAEKTLGYEQYIMLARELGCGSLIKISMVELGNAYLTTILPKTTAGMLDVKRMTFPQFWEVLVRWAVLSQKGREQDNAPIDEKIKAMFLEMWYYLQDSIPNVVGTHYVAPPCVGESSKASFLKGCQALNERCIKMWAADKYRIYLGPPEVVKRDAAKILDLAVKEMRSLADVRHATINQYLTTNLAAAREDVLLEVEGGSDETVGDPRITVSLLNQLLQARPECSKYLFAQLKSYKASAF